MKPSSKYSCQLLVAVCFVLVAQSLSAQQFMPLTREYTNRLEKALNARDVDFHTSVKPYSKKEVMQALNYDSIVGDQTYFVQLNINDGDLDSNNLSIWTRPLFQLEPGFESSDSANGGLFRSGIGFNVGARYKDDLAFDFNWMSSNGSYADYLNDFIADNRVVPGEGYAYGTNAGYHNRFVSGYLSYDAGKYFNLAVGHGKHFWGDGYRSLLLSDVANNYSYARITTNIWRFKYVNLYGKMKDMNVPGARYYSDFRSKYITAHYLTWNVTKWFTVDLFESIVWQGQDTLYNRGFDPAYLNPMVFYRPVEFSRGSPDNALMGAGIKIVPHDHWQIYGQLILDEFLLGEVRARNGWWANKQGGQLGVKWFDAFGLENLKAQGEINIVRPFTYSHQPTSQNWGHANQPLAHPLGANFIESIGILQYQSKRWSLEGKITVARFGTDSSATVSIGQDIYRPYLEFNDSHGHTIGQGVETTLNTNELRFSYRLVSHMDIIAEVAVLNRNYRALGNTDMTNFLTFSIRTPLTELYRDF